MSSRTSEGDHHRLWCCVSHPSPVSLGLCDLFSALRIFSSGPASVPQMLHLLAVLTRLGRYGARGGACSMGRMFSLILMGRVSLRGAYKPTATLCNQDCHRQHAVTPRPHPVPALLASASVRPVFLSILKMSVRRGPGHAGGTWPTGNSLPSTRIVRPCPFLRHFRLVDDVATGCGDVIRCNHVSHVCARTGSAFTRAQRIWSVPSPLRTAAIARGGLTSP